MTIDVSAENMYENARAALIEIEVLAEQILEVTRHPTTVRVHAEAILEKIRHQPFKTLRKPLFVHAPIVLHSGGRSNFKIECDALTPADWEGLAAIAQERIIGSVAFGEIVGVPRGGLPFAAALQKYVVPGSEWWLVVDDVLTTGRSMVEAMTGPKDVGLVAFARGPIPNKSIAALFTLGGD